MKAAIKYGSVDVYLTKFKPMKHTMPTGRGEEDGSSEPHRDAQTCIFVLLLFGILASAHVR
eukprot:4323005-Amphidinium_carterae.1